MAATTVAASPQWLDNLFDRRLVAVVSVRVLLTASGRKT
jgi:hypothetical protein